MLRELVARPHCFSKLQINMIKIVKVCVCGWVGGGVSQFF